MSVPPPFGRHADGNGLYLYVQRIGTRSWIQPLVIRGRKYELGLGRVRLVSLAEAREQALASRKLARAGGDPLPLADKRRSRGMPTFADAAITVIARLGNNRPCECPPFSSSFRDLPHEANHGVVVVGVVSPSPRAQVRQDLASHIQVGGDPDMRGKHPGKHPGARSCGRYTHLKRPRAQVEDGVGGQRRRGQQVEVEQSVCLVMSAPYRHFAAVHQDAAANRRGNRFVSVCKCLEYSGLGREDSRMVFSRLATESADHDGDRFR